MTQVQSESYALRLRSFQENEYYGRIVANWKPHEQHSFALGGEWSHEEFGLPHTSYPDKGIWFQMTGMATSFDDSTAMPRWSTNLKSVFTEYQWNINDQWTTFVGARLDDHPYTEQMFSPRGALIYTPTDKDTVKLIASRSSRTDSAALMKLNRSNGGENNVETLKSIELRYERQQTENLWLAGDIFYNWHDILGVGADWVGNKLLGEMKSYGFELEASYRKGKTRVDLSHSMSKMLEFDLNNGITSLEITAAPFGYGNDLANWSNHTTKLVVHYDLAERWKLDSSANVYWGYPGGEDYAEYKNDTSSLHDVYKPGFSKSFRPSIFVNLGVEHKISKNKTLRVDGYNLLGFIDHDLNKRRVGFNTDYPAQYRCHAPAVGISYQHKF